jgi:hypothetical protein
MGKASLTTSTDLGGKINYNASAVASVPEVPEVRERLG